MGHRHDRDVTLVEGIAHVFVAVDHCNSECVGIHADKSANRFQALEPVRQGVRQPEGNGVAERFIPHERCSRVSHNRGAVQTDDP